MAGALIRRYEKLLLDNISAVSTIENGIRNVTWLLPGRFQDAEVASEGLYTVLNLVTSYHDTLIRKRISPSDTVPPSPFAPSLSQSPPLVQHREDGDVKPSSAQPTAPRTTPLLPPPSDHTRYTRFWQKQSLLYRKASRALTILGYVELLTEMLARKRGDRARWRVVVFIESIKTFLRLLLLRLTRRPVLHHPTPYREYEPSTLPPEITTAPRPNPFKQSLGTSKTVSAESRLASMHGSTLRAHLQPLLPSLPPSHQPHALSLLPELDRRGYIGEVLNASAGLVHVLLLLRWANRQSTSPYRPLSLPTLSRSFSPFLIPLVMRLIARHLRQPLSSSSSATQTATPLLAEHYAAQDKRLLAAFFFTGPIWIGWTRPKIQSWIEWLEKWPLLGLLGGFGEGYLPLVDDYFYCACDFDVDYAVQAAVGCNMEWADITDTSP